MQQEEGDRTLLSPPPPPPPTPTQPVDPRDRCGGKIHINAHCQAEKQSIKRVVTYDWGRKQIPYLPYVPEKRYQRTICETNTAQNARKKRAPAPWNDLDFQTNLFWWCYCQVVEVVEAVGRVGSDALPIPCSNWTAMKHSKTMAWTVTPRAVVTMTQIEIATQMDLNKKNKQVLVPCV